MCVKAVGHISYMQIRRRGGGGELVHKDAFAPLKKQQMCNDAEPEASCSRAVGQQHSKPCHPWSEACGERRRADGQGRVGMERREYAGRGHAVQGHEDKKDFVMRAY